MDLDNGGFETPVVPGHGWVTLHPGGDLGGWTIVSGSVDLLRPDPAHAGAPDALRVHSGAQSLDLSGGSAGTVRQTFATIPGHLYDVEYWVNSNPHGRQSYGLPESGDDWQVAVTGATEPVEQRGHWTGTGAGDAETGPAHATDGTWELWGPRGLTAAGSSMTVTFQSLELNAWGVILDDVAVTTENRDPVVADGSITTTDSMPSAPYPLPTTDADGDAVTYAVSDPEHGSVELAADGSSLVYQPDAGYLGTDAFTVTGSDAHGGSDTGLITVTVDPAQYASTITNTRPSQGAPTNAKGTVVMHARVVAEDPGCVAGRVVTVEVAPVAPSSGETQTLTRLTDASGEVAAKFAVSPGTYQVTSRVAATEVCGSSTDSDPYSSLSRSA